MSGVVVIVQARVGSTRLPGKVLKDIEGKPMLLRVIERVRMIRDITRVVVATTTALPDAEILRIADAFGIEVFAGSEADVLDRYYQTALKFDAGVIVRVTADCPLLAPEVSALVLSRFLQGDVDYVTNCLPPTYPDGLDTEVMSFEALERAWRDARLTSEREHVTPFIWKQPEVFRIARVMSDMDRSDQRWTVDDERDLEFVREVYRRLLPRYEERFGMKEVMDLLIHDPKVRTINAGTARNEGYAVSLAKEAESDVS